MTTPGRVLPPRGVLLAALPGHSDEDAHVVTHLLLALEDAGYTVVSRMRYEAMEKALGLCKHEPMPFGYLGGGFHDKGCHSERHGDDGCDCTLRHVYEAKQIAARVTPAQEPR